MRPALTRAAIVEEARRSIIADGLEALSLRRIASALDVTAPALYAYVTDKGDLLRAVAEGELADLYPVMFIFPPDFAPGAPEGADFPMASQAFALSAAAVTEAIETGAFRPLDPLQASLVLFTAAHGAATVLLMPFGFDRATEDALIDATVETVLSGLQPR